MEIYGSVGEAGELGQRQKKIISQLILWQLVWVIYRLDLKKPSCCHTMLVYKSCWLIEFIVVFLCSFFPWQLRIPSLHGGLNVAWSIKLHPTYLGLVLVMDRVSKGVCMWSLMSCVKSSKMKEYEEKSIVRLAFNPYFVLIFRLKNPISDTLCITTFKTT